MSHAQHPGGVNIHVPHGQLSNSPGDATLIGGRSSYAGFHHAMQTGHPIGSLNGHNQGANSQAQSSFGGGSPAHVVALSNVRVKHIRPAGPGIFHFDINYESATIPGRSSRRPF